MNRATQRTIFAACKELGLDDEARQDLQLEVCGKSSMRDMNDDDMKAVLNRLKRDGFKQVSKRRKHAPAPRADLRLVHVLWRKLGDAGALTSPGRKGLNTFIRKRFEDTWKSVPADVDMLRDPQKIDAVIAALRAWGKRENIDFDWKRS